MKSQADKVMIDKLELGTGIEGKSTAQGTSIQASRVESADDSALV